MSAAYKHISTMYVCFLFLPASKNVSDWWLAYWISQSHSHPGALLNTSSSPALSQTARSYSPGVVDDAVLLVGSVSGSANYTALREASDSLQFYLGVYGGLAAANSVSYHTVVTVYVC